MTEAVFGLALVKEPASPKVLQTYCRALLYYFKRILWPNMVSKASSGHLTASHPKML